VSGGGPGADGDCSGRGATGSGTGAAHGHTSGRAAPGPERLPARRRAARLEHRPSTVDRTVYQHNFQAARSFHVGPYHRPPGWRTHQWGYGEILPRAYWSSQYILADYWLFALEVPPVGYEWVRVGNDALLVSTGNGEVLQVEYGVFA